MSLPLPWIDKIFEKLTLVYGQQFLARWRDIELGAVKADWAHELDGFERRPEAIKWALQNLPLKEPPTVLMFRELARRAPEPERPKLPNPPCDLEKRRAVFSKLAELKKHFVEKEAEASLKLSRGKL